MKRRLLISAGVLTLLVVTALLWPRRQVANIRLSHNPYKLWQGSRLSEKHCAACHLKPEPDQLETTAWLYMTAYMGLMLGRDEGWGLDQAQNRQFKSRRGMLRHLGLLPEKPLLDQNDWKLLVNYYLFFSEPSAAGVAGPPETDARFSVKDSHFDIQAPGVTMLHYEDGRLFSGLAVSDALAVSTMTAQTKLVNLDSAPVRHYDFKGSHYLSLIGDLLGSIDKVLPGSILTSAAPDGPFKQALDRLPRTAGGLPCDLNGDGRTDFIVPGFGLPGKGELAVYYGLEQGFFKQVLATKSGGVKVILRDFNGDGRDDILYLQSDSDESVILYTSTGLQAVSPQKNQTLPDGFKEAGFTQAYLERFNSSTGLTDFFLHDVDADGRPELVVTAGDNADSGPYYTLKPYQGLYIYSFTVSDGRVGLKQRLFYRLPGAYGARLADFDLDGQTDIAVVSYYADVRAPVDMVILYGQGGYEFKARRVENLPAARFTVIESADADNDGDTDLFLGISNLPYSQVTAGGLVNRSFKPAPSAVLYLENTTR